MFSVRLAQRIIPAESIRNSAGRAISAPLRPCATMQEIVTSNHFRFRIGQECVGETQFLALTAIDFRWVDTNRGEMNPARFKFRKPMLKTPQLGVAQRSPETAIEDQQDSF
jgi:hypothetical protein